MKMKSFFKALSLPLLATILLSVSMLVAVYVSGVTRISVWTNSSPNFVRSKLHMHPFGSSLYLQRETAQESSEIETHCGDIATKITVEIPAYKVANADSLTSWLKNNRVNVCDGPSFTNNQVSQSSSNIAQYMSGWQWLIMLTASFFVVFSLYRRQKFEKQSDFLVSANSIQLACVGIAGAGLIFCIRVATTGLQTTEASLAYAMINDNPSLTLPILLSIGLMIPLIEETSFRAWLISVSNQHIRRASAIAFSTVIFAAAHWIFDFPSVFFYIGAGTVLSLLWLWTRSIITCAFAHGSYNVAIALMT